MGLDIDVDLAALQPVLLIELTVVLWGSIPIANLHKGIPQQQREAMTVQAPRS
jgi:glucose uptake protein GlcU